MYSVISAASLITRIYLCYLTIETLPIFAESGLNWLIGQIFSVYTIFRLICYPLTGYIVEKIGIENPSLRAMVYFIVYLPIIGIYWAVLLAFTYVFGVLPIHLN